MFCPRSGLTPTPFCADVAGGHGEIGHAHDHGGSLAVLGDAEAVVDRCIAAGGVEPRGGANIRRRNTGEVLHGFRRIAFFGDEIAPLLERRDVAALLDELLVQQAFGDDDVGEGVDDGDVGAGQQRQMIVRLDVRRLDQIDAARIDDDQPRALRAAAASSAKRTPDAHRLDSRR